MAEIESLKNRGDFYHVVIRGGGRQRLFFEKEDLRACQRIILKVKEQYEFHLYAYSMMNHHIHLLIKCTYTDVSVVIKRILSLYAMYINHHYDRTKDLFRSSFYSEKIEEKSCFLTAMVYIHGLPLRAGITDSLEDYPYSSYREYVKGVPGMTDKRFVMMHCSIERFIGLHAGETGQKAGYNRSVERRTEAEAMRLLHEKINNNNPQAFSDLNIISQRSCVKQLKRENVSYAQIARITGLPYERIRYLGNMK